MVAAAGCADQPAGPRELVVDLMASSPATAASGTATARKVQDGTAYLVPFGVRLDFLIATPGAAVVTCDALRGLGPQGRLEVVLEVDGEPAQSVGEWRAGAACAPLALGAPRSAARLSLRAHAIGDPKAAGGVVIERPRVEAPARAEAAPASSRQPRPPPPRNVLVYLVDTLRADRQGCYGFAGGLSPRLDAFAADATVFTRAVAQASWTRAAVATLFTGQYPPTHGVEGRRGALAPESVTIAEMLAERGFATVGFVSNPNLSRHTKMHQGFAEYILPPRRHNLAAPVNGLVVQWLEKRDPNRPFFMYVHTVDPHSPYEPVQEFRARFAADVDRKIGTRAYLHDLYISAGIDPAAAVRPLLDLYAAEVAQNDAAFGALLDALDRFGLADDTAVVFLSDHGEEFHEHGMWEHGRTLYNEVIDVPLVVRLPGWGRGTRVATPVGQIDVLPTLLEVLGIPLPAALEGRSLLPAMTAGTALPPTPVYSYLNLDGYRASSVELDGWKLIRRVSTEGAVEELLFERASDPGETRDRAAEAPIRVAYLRDQLARRTSKAPTPASEADEIDAETAAQLRALGYIN